MGDIVLIGPPKAGKTTVGKLLAERLGRPLFNLGDGAQPYYAAEGWSEEEARGSWMRGGFEAWFRYMRPYDALALEGGLAEHAGSVIELGAMQPAFDEPALQERARAALAPHAVVLLRPSPDTAAAARTLQERQQLTYNGQEIIAYFARHPANFELAKQTVYTAGRSVEQTVDEVAAALDPSEATVVLIGPINAGKSTVSKPLAERLGRPRVALDAIRWDYYKEIGWTEEEQRRRGEQGAQAVLDYWKPFEVHGVARVLEDHRGSIIDFGAGHSVYDDPDQMATVRALLAPLRNVVLLYPSPDTDEATEILRGRSRLNVGGVEQNRYLLDHPGLRELATITVFTDGKTPEATADEVLARLPKDAL